jgi:hypothetical protein
MTVSQTYSQTLPETDRFWIGTVSPVPKSAKDFSDGS